MDVALSILQQCSKESVLQKGKEQMNKLNILEWGPAFCSHFVLSAPETTKQLHTAG